MINTLMKLRKEVPLKLFLAFQFALDLIPTSTSRVLLFVHFWLSFEIPNACGNVNVSAIQSGPNFKTLRQDHLGGRRVPKYK